MAFIAALLSVGAVGLSQGAEVTADVHALAITESLISYCQRIDPTATAQLKKHDADLAKGIDAHGLRQLRDSDEYRAAYQSLQQFVARVDEHNARRPCQTAASMSKPAAAGTTDASH